MRYLLLLVVLSSAYFVEWIPNNATSTASGSTTDETKGEFPWQLSG